MKKLKTTFVILFFLFTSVKLMAQDDCGCDAALKQATQDRFHSSYRFDFKQTISIIFSHDFTYWETGEGSHSTDVETGAAYAVYSGFFNGSETSQQKEAKFNEEKQYYSQNTDISQSTYIAQSQKTASAVVYNDWLECKKSCISGDYVLLSKTVTGDELTITVYWHHQNTSNQEKIAAIIPSNAIQTDSSNLRRDQTINGQSSYTGQFRILDIHKDASVKIDVSEYAVNPIIVPAVKVDDITSIYPIGTIISSMLDFDSFNKLTNNNENTGADVWSFKSKWAPCDGRPVGGSKYNVWAGAVGANAPDLRGVFLRGLNQFAPDEPTSVSANQKDPETKKAGEFQNDDLKSHTHTLKIPQFYGSSATPAGGPGVAGNNYLTYTTSTQTTGDATHPGDETRPKNVSIYYYIRIN